MTTSVAVDAGTVFSVAGVLHVLIVAAVGTHVLLNKQNEGAAFSWLGIVTLSPFLGAVLYWVFGINRIRRHAQAELPREERTGGRVAPLPGLPPERLPDVPLGDGPGASAADIADRAGTPGTAGPEADDRGWRPANRAWMSALPPRWQGLTRLGLAIHPAPYLEGNEIVPLIDGDEAYPAMLEAIDAAESSVVLSSYIFEHDAAGERFVAALIRAQERGVSVRVLIDGLGVGYGLSLVRADRVLRKAGVPTARFLPFLSRAGVRFLNLRNHRKILSVDGRIAFVGGMNIRAGNLLSLPSRHHTRDTHFRVRGPVIDQVNAVFAEDWQFACGERLSLPSWKAEAVAGPLVSRVVLDGPDDNYQKLQHTMIGAINVARRSVDIVTPYFLPGRTVLSALEIAALRGVRVRICVPAKNNLPFVGWAMRANERELAGYGIELFESPPPFDHSKLLIVDERWTLIGSSNWDARSLELNFEINLECYDPAFNARVRRIIAAKLAEAKALDGERIDPLPARLRNNFFRLFSPYL